MNKQWPGAAAQITDGKHVWKQNTFADALDTTRGVLLRESFHKMNTAERTVAMIAIGAYVALGGKLE